MKKNHTVSAGVTIVIEQILSASIIIAAIRLKLSFTIIVSLVGAVGVINLILFFLNRRITTRHCSGLENIVLSRFHSGAQTSASAASLLEHHMQACQASRQGTKKMINEGKDYSLSLTQKMKESVYTTTRINGSVHTINEKIGSLNNDILSSMAAIEQITQTIASFEHQIETQSGSVVQTSAAIEEMDASITNVRGITDKKKEASTRLVKMTQTGRVQMENMGKLVNSINSNIDAIQQINQMIDDIAAQTSLLSMNAAIEAAHAGEAGKGFAVVSGEIRKLSESTAKNAKLISNTLKDIIAKVKSIQESSAVNLKNYTGITEESGNMADAFKEINQATTELSAGSNEIVKATQNLINITTSIKGGSREIAASSEHIKKSIQSVVAASEESTSETASIANVAQDLNMVFLEISNVFLKYEDAVSRIQRFQDSEFGEAADASFNPVPVMIQHLLWIIRVRGVLDGKMQLDKNSLVDHTTCQLGKWMASKEAEHFRNQKDFMDMTANHEKMHALVKEIIQADTHIDPDVLEKKFNDLLSYSEKILETLFNMGKEQKKILQKAEALPEIR